MGKKKLKVCYLTWGETPRSYGVFGSQVIKQFVETKKLFPESEFYFISGLPLIHSGLIREKIKYYKEIEKVRKLLNGIKLSILPIFAPQNFVNSSKSTFRLMHFLSQKILAKKLFRINPDIVHCRSYHAAWAALSLKNRYGLKYKIVFDARGIYPEEVSIKKNYSLNDKNYQYLKGVEKELLEKCDAVIAVSDTMMEHFAAISNKNNIWTIYLSADIKNLRIENNLVSRKEKNRIDFVYVGALSENTWHKPKDLLKLYENIRNYIPNSKITIVTTSNHQEIRKIFSSIPQNEFEITSSKTTQQLKTILANMDFGLMSYFNPKNEKDKVLAKMVLAVKTAEYAAAGLPIIVNDACGGASYLVNTYKLGFSYNPNNFGEITSEKILGYHLDRKNLERSKIAYKLFDYENNAKKYSEIYFRLMNFDDENI